TSYIYSVYFFFQAEDGIRDRNVTGVQTCALPISSPRPRTSSTCSTTPTRCWPTRSPRTTSSAPGPDCGPCCSRAPRRARAPRRRSEERRVGKERRCGRGAGAEKRQRSRKKQQCRQ